MCEGPLGYEKAQQEPQTFENATGGASKKSQQYVLRHGQTSGKTATRLD